MLQIFSAKAVGPIFFEFIQRKEDEGFGEGAGAGLGLRFAHAPQPATQLVPDWRQTGGNFCTPLLLTSEEGHLEATKAFVHVRALCDELLQDRGVVVPRRDVAPRVRP